MAREFDQVDRREICSRHPHRVAQQRLDAALGCMATDFAYAAFLLPVLICIAVLIALAVIGSPSKQNDTAFLGLGRVRLARGYLGAIFVTLICSAIGSTQLGFTKVSLGHITDAELRQLLPGYIFYFFVLTVPFVLAALTVVGLPALAILRKLRALTIIWASAGALLFSAVVGARTMLSPYNRWCTTHLLECGAQSMFSCALLAVPVTLGFFLAARIPLRRTLNTG
jgi:purine-cytosine permease-like protein